MGYTIDIDTGGTFTDGFVANGHDVRTVKVPTTPHDLTVCFLACIEAGAQAFGRPLGDFLFETDIIRFSNTIGTNAIIQRDGSKIGLVVSPGMAALAPTTDAEGKAPLVAPDMVLEVEESTAEDGTVHGPVGDAALMAATQALIDRGARGIVIAFRNSEHNPANERAARAIIKREYPRDYLGSVSVFLASDISPRSGLAQRLNSAVLNAYIHAKLARLLFKAGEDLRQRGYRGTLFIGHNNGAVARVAKTRAINTYNSGPAAGLLGAREIGALYGIGNLVSTDMGGTSFDIGFVREGAASYALEPDIEGFPANLPMMSILALGAGGGSIARLVDGELAVGPQSAGALPGPACFGLGGTEPTVTDANLVLGLLDPDYFLGGSMKLDVARARDAIGRVVAGPLGITVEDAAARIKATIDRSMGEAVARVARQLPAGSDPVIVAYGGAGGIHAADIAAAAGIRRTIMTPFSSVSSAYSSSLLDAGHLYYRRVDQRFGAGMQAPVAEALDAMWREARRDMRGEGFADAAVSAEVQLFLAARPGGAEVMVQATEAFASDPAAAAAAGQAAQAALAAAGESPDGTLHLVTLALMVRAPVPHYRLPEQALAGGDPAPARKSHRAIYVAAQGTFVEAPVYDRARLAPGTRVSGPAVVESAQTTIALPAGTQLGIDRFGNAVIEEA